MAKNRRNLLLVVLCVFVLFPMIVACDSEILDGLGDVEDVLDDVDPCGNRGECSSDTSCPNYCAPGETKPNTPTGL